MSTVAGIKDSVLRAPWPHVVLHSFATQPAGSYCWIQGYYFVFGSDKDRLAPYTVIASDWPPTYSILQLRNLRTAAGSAYMNWRRVAFTPADQQHPSFRCVCSTASRISTTHWRHSQDLYRTTSRKCKMAFISYSTARLGLTRFYENPWWNE